jgi:hypothetical protein
VLVSNETSKKNLELLIIFGYSSGMVCENVSSADNQQERLEQIGRLVGFTDGEGAFTVSILKNSTCKTGWQVFPEFIVTQGAKSKDALNLFSDILGCGKTYVNHRFDNHNEDIYRYCVRSLKDLSEKVIPFFKVNPLRTYKAEDFKIFCSVMDLIQNREHLTQNGLIKIAYLAMEMNRKVKPKFLESPLTICQTSYKDEEIVASAWRHAGV